MIEYKRFQNKVVSTYVTTAKLVITNWQIKISD